MVPDEDVSMLNMIPPAMFAMFFSMCSANGRHEKNFDRFLIFDLRGLAMSFQVEPFIDTRGILTWAAIEGGELLGRLELDINSSDEWILPLSAMGYTSSNATMLRTMIHASRVVDVGQTGWHRLSWLRSCMNRSHGRSFLPAAPGLAITNHRKLYSLVVGCVRRCTE